MITVKVSKPTIKKVEGILPTVAEFDAILEDVYADVDAQIEVGALTGIAGTEAYARDIVKLYYVGDAPAGVNIGTNTVCHGSGVQVTTYAVYYCERRAAYHPEDFKKRYGRYPYFYLRANGKTYHVHTMAGPYSYRLGRAGGHVGWDKKRDMFAFGLASFRHNFQVLMGVFTSRPKIPVNRYWYLPNLIYMDKVREIEAKYGMTIVSPPYAIPPASYAFSFHLPTPLMVLVVGTKCPRDTEAYIELWNAAKVNLIDPQKVTFPKGDSETTFTFTAIPPAYFMQGYFNINPVNSDMTVGYCRNLVPPITR